MPQPAPPDAPDAPLPGTAEAWTIFWTEQGQNSRCMARSPEICERLDAHWRGVASRLSGDSKVIDLGCGTGSVGRALRSVEPRLHVVGVDIAKLSPSNEPGLDLIAETAMEALPFPGSSFGAAVSQFGYEYGNGDKAADELARVLVPGAPLSLLIHHPDSPVIDDMRRHREAIRAACAPAVRTAFVSGNELVLAEQFESLRRNGLNDPIIGTVGRGLQKHIGGDETHRTRIWKAITEALAPELAMLDSLDLLRGDAQDAGFRMQPLARSFELAAPGVLRDEQGEPIAWIVEGNRIA